MNTITTSDELDALPVGSVVMEGDNGCPVPWVGGICVMPGVWHRFPDGWYVVAGHGARVPEFDLGPLTVLYCPDQPPRTEEQIKAEALREVADILGHATYCQPDPDPDPDRGCVCLISVLYARAAIAAARKAGLL